MAPGSIAAAGEEMVESHPNFADDYDEVQKKNRKYIIIRKNGKSSPSPSPSPSEGMQELLQCPVCKTSMYPPIHQCPNGHTLCSDCKINNNRCPDCRHELGNIRCLALERVAESLHLPCRFHRLGCDDVIPYPTKQNHELNCCMFRPYTCPYAGSECSITGDIPYLVNHLKDDHKVDTHDGSTFNHRYVKSNPNEVENATWMMTVFNCLGRHFCLHFEAFQLGTTPVYMAFLRFMGEESEARRFSYVLEVGGQGRKLSWHGVPRSIRDCHRKVRDSQDGLLITRSLALFFSGSQDWEELKLRVTGRIWKDQEE